MKTPFFPLACATKALMTLPNSDKLVLILAPSFKVAPEAPVLFCRSLPARSTRLTFANRPRASVCVCVCVCDVCVRKTEGV